jgi:hypothetical protein
MFVWLAGHGACQQGAAGRAAGRNTAEGGRRGSLQGILGVRHLRCCCLYMFALVRVNEQVYGLGSGVLCMPTITHMAACARNVLCWLGAQALCCDSTAVAGRWAPTVEARPRGCAASTARDRVPAHSNNTDVWCSGCIRSIAAKSQVTQPHNTKPLGPNFRPPCGYLLLLVDSKLQARAVAQES